MSISDNFCFLPCDILLPRNNPERFAVNACDQHTSDPEYWAEADEITGEYPGALRLILPEAYLGEQDINDRLSDISEAGAGYLSGGVFNTYENSFILTKRTFPGGLTRTGLVGVLNLDYYDYTKPGMRIAPSEETVPSRLPARIKVLESQRIETSHAIALIDDKEKTVIEPIVTENLELLYSFELMQNGGHIEGYRITGAEAERAAEAIEALPGDIKIVIGDGNHSVAAAKVSGRRYVLAEICNVYDEGIVFEPIHRVVFGAGSAVVIETDRARDGAGSSYASLIAGTDEAIEKMEHTSIDYIHGTDAARRLAAEENALAIILPAMEKSELFNTVRERGKFPKKSFSIGHSNEKRYYLECKIPE